MKADSRFDIYFFSPKKLNASRRDKNAPKVGYIRKTDAGEVWVVDWRFPEGSSHGGTELHKFYSINSLMERSLVSFRPASAMTIDTETTGLAGGTGTYAFIIGAGFWIKKTFIVRQYVMRDFNEEPAQLLAFAEDCRRQLISFNGKCFDIPLLTNRFRIHRLASPLESTAHLDMLYCCRRLWKRHFESFRLNELEKRLLGFARTDDVPSYLIPSIFFDYLQSRDESQLYPILNHNRDDILSLHQLVLTASNIANETIRHGSNDDDLLLSLAEISFLSGDYQEALRLIEKINGSFASRPTLVQALKLRAHIFKKLRRWEEALDTYIKLGKYDLEISALVESAKLCEHRLRNPMKALEFVRRAEIAMEFEADDLNGHEKIRELGHRKGRLLRKLNRLSHIRN